MGRTRLTSLTLSGFKSFAYQHESSRSKKAGAKKRHDRVDFGDVTVLLGANGAGKSNVVSFFRMLNFITTRALQDFIGRYGGAASLLHYGPQVTPRMGARLDFAGEDWKNGYVLELASAAPDTLIFTNETVEYHRTGYATPQTNVLGAGHKESSLEESALGGDKTAEVVLHLLRRCNTFQFHDTSENAKIRKGGYIEDAKYLRADAGNLAAYLYAMQKTERPFYDRIVRTIRQVCPQFSDFELAPSELNPNNVLLNWREKHQSDYLMGPHQLSDGTLRFMALATLFLQAPDGLPSLIVIDEPELGLHPQAIAVLAGLIKAVSQHAQVILATQSVRFVDYFELGEIRPIEHRSGVSRVLDLNPDEFSEWLEDYSTGELWEKNVFGGGPKHE